MVMKKYVIVSSDDSHYLDFWILIRDAWVELGFHPVLALVANKYIPVDTQEELEDNGTFTTLYLREVPNVPVSCQAQVARWYAAKYFPNDLVMTSDIDMMPLQGEYFHKAFDSYIAGVSILSHDAYEIDGQEQYPMCYNIATGKVFTDLLKMDMSWEDWIKSLEPYGYGWCTDEAYFYHRVRDTGIPVKAYKRGWNRECGEAHNRIDRNTWVYDEQKVRDGYYIDAHLIRPFKQHETEITKLFNLIPKLKIAA